MTRAMATFTLYMNLTELSKGRPYLEFSAIYVIFSLSTLSSLKRRENWQCHQVKFDIAA